MPYLIIDLSTYITSLILGGWILFSLINFIRILFLVIKKESMPEDGLPLNFLRIPSYMTSKEKNITRVIVYIVFYIGLIGIVINMIPYTRFGSEKIGSYIEKQEYRTFYFVNLFPIENESKNYRVKAEIYSTIVEYSDEKGSFSERHYYIEEAFFDNKNSIKFERWGWDKPLKLDKKVRIEDDLGVFWNIELTNIKVD